MGKRLPKSTLATRLYLAAFLSIAAWSILTISYLEGRAAELSRRANEHQVMVDKALDDREYWRGKYESLSREADWLTVTQAEAKFQEGGE
jgi:hypothetical protein